MADLRGRYTPTEPGGTVLELLDQPDTTDPQTEFLSVLRDQGFDAKLPIQEDQIVRMASPTDKKGKESGWYVYQEFPDDYRPGSLIAFGTYGSWKEDVPRGTWCSKSATGLSQAERAGIKVKRETAKREATAKIEAEYASAALEARERLSKAQDADPSHPYLTRKKIKPYGLFHAGNILLVPVYGEDGEVQSVQTIKPDGEKRFQKGCKMFSGHHVIRGGNETIVIAEGYSTAASIHEATHATTYVAFNAGNLERVAGIARREHPTAQITIAGDNDQWTPGNPGKAKATRAAEAIGARVLFPLFTDLSGEPTDFNDLHCREGLQAVHEQIMGAGEKRRPRNLSPMQILGNQALRDVLPLVGPGLLYRRKGLLLVGAAKVGKSMMVMDLTRAMVCGPSRWLGFDIPRPLKVWYLNGELDEDDLQERYDDYVQHLDSGEIEKWEQNFRITEPIDFQLDDAGEGRRILAEMGQSAFGKDKPDVIIIDPMVEFCPVDENDSQGMIRFINGQLYALRDQINPDAAIIMVHHVRKASPETMRLEPFNCIRGTSALRGKFQTNMVLYQPEEGDSARTIALEGRRKGIPSRIHGRFVNCRFESHGDGGPRLAGQRQGLRHDLERARQKNKIIDVLAEEAKGAKLYTARSLSDYLDGKHNLGSASSIKNKIRALVAQGMIRFTNDYGALAPYGVTPSTSKDGYLVVPGMEIEHQVEDGEIAAFGIEPTHYKDSGSNLAECTSDHQWPEYKGGGDD